MSDNETVTAPGYLDTATGEEIEGKAYVLKTTEGEEIVDPARLFTGDGSSDEKTRAALDELFRRVENLENSLGVEPKSEEPQE